MKKTIIFFCSIILINFNLYSDALDVFQIIPQPQSIQLKGGKGLKFNELTYISAQSDTLIPVLGNILSALPQIEKKGKSISLELTNQNIPNHEEGYLIEVNNKGIVIKARTKVGLFYGCQTLEQLLEDSKDFKIEIPAMIIKDYPTLSYRAVHFDTKHHLSNMAYYYQCIDKLARYKINAVIWEIEDKLRYRRRPEIGSPNAISIQEMQSLSSYAKERNIDISPLVQGLGHAGFILKHHWELRENPNSDWEFCPSNTETYELQFDLYLDAIEAMPHGKYLHVGGDEISKIGICDRCVATGKNAFELQMIWLKKVSDFVVKQGRIPIFWDDMPLKYADVYNTILSNMTEEELKIKWNPGKLDTSIDLFPKECIYMRWNYGDATKPAHKKILEWYKSKGLKVMGATAASAGDSPFMPRENSKAQYIKDFSQLVADNDLVGILSTAWDDGSAHWETVWRGFIAQGEYGWNPYHRGIDKFKIAHSQREFGLNTENKSILFLDSLEKSAFFFDHALRESGHRNPALEIWNTFKVIDLPDKTKAGEWSKKYKTKVEEAIQTTKRYELIKRQIKDVKANALRNRYTIEVYEQTNELFYFPAKLIIALYNYDQKANESTIKDIKDTIEYFSIIKMSYIDILSKSRFMENPKGYIMDQNQHKHLAARTQNSDWIFLFEIPMIAKTEQWLKDNR